MFITKNKKFIKKNIRIKIIFIVNINIIVQPMININENIYYTFLSILMYIFFFFEYFFSYYYLVILDKINKIKEYFNKYTKTIIFIIFSYLKKTSLEYTK